MAAEDDPDAGGLPGFRYVIGKRSPPVLADLPLPEVSFGLELTLEIDADGQLKQLARFPRLQVLQHHLHDASAAGIKAIAELKGVEHLAVASNLADGGLAGLGRMAALQSLELSGDRITDQLFKPLADLRKLQRFRLDGGYGCKGVTGAGLREFRALADLQYVGLTYSFGLSAEGMKGVAALKQIRELDLYASSVTDACLDELVQLAELRWLRLGDCKKVTDKGLAAIGRLSNLPWLNLQYWIG